MNLDIKYYNERLQFVRDMKNITQKELANYLGIKQQQYARYEKGVNVMPVTHLAKICIYLQVSADFILGLSEDMAFPKNSKYKVKEPVM